MGNQLLYIWINDYGILLQEGFNFNPEWNIEFNVSNNTLFVKKLEGIPENFFGEKISNVSALIGSNGSGKSTLIDFLVTSYFTANNYYSNNFLAVWKVNDDRLVVHILKSFKDSIEEQFNIVKEGCR